MTEAVFQHPATPTTDVHRIQSVMYLTPVTKEPTTSVLAIAEMASTGESLTKQTLSDALCIAVKRSGGPELFRKNKNPKTVTKVFDAVSEPFEQGLIPVACHDCPMSNFKKRTGIRDRKTSGCIILGIRRRKMLNHIQGAGSSEF